MRAAKPPAVRTDDAARFAAAGEARSAERNAGRRRLRACASVCAVLALALLGVAAYLRPADFGLPPIADLLARADQWRSSPLAPWIALACFVVGGLVVFPVNLLIAATIVVLGPVRGGVFALAGAVSSAALVYELGRLLPPTAFVRVAGSRGERLRRRAVGHGVLAVALVRLVPVAPYSVIGFVAGAARIRRGGYLLGTALGMAPGVVLYALFVDRARAVLLDPHPFAWLGLGVAIALILGVAVLVRLRARRRGAARDA